MIHSFGHQHHQKLGLDNLRCYHLTLYIIPSAFYLSLSFLQSRLSFKSLLSNLHDVPGEASSLFSCRAGHGDRSEHLTIYNDRREIDVRSTDIIHHHRHSNRSSNRVSTPSSFNHNTRCLYTGNPNSITIGHIKALKSILRSRNCRNSCRQRPAPCRHRPYHHNHMPQTPPIPGKAMAQPSS